MITYFDITPAENQQYLNLAASENSGPSLFLSLSAAGNMGPSDDTTNPRKHRMYRYLGIGNRPVISLRQIHSKTVHEVSGESAGKPVMDGDGMITADNRVFLQITAADCLPVYLYHEGGKGFGIVHSGWKGTGIAAEAAAAMCRRYHLSAEDIAVVIGPGIGACCYDVDEQRAEIFRTRWGEEAVQEREGKHFLDLRAANAALLAAAGVENIRVCSACTSCGTGFGSFRREGPEHFSRMIALIGYL